MKRILVPFDGSASAQRAMAHAMQLARPGPDRWLHLLNVQLPLVRPGCPAAPALPGLHDDLHRQGLLLLAEAEALAASASVPCELEVRIGDPLEQIAAAAQDNGCHAIVMGAPRGITDLSRLHAAAGVPVTLIH